MTSKVKFILKVNFDEFLDCVWRKAERIYKTVTKSVTGEMKFFRRLCGEDTNLPPPYKPL